MLIIVIVDLSVGLLKYVDYLKLKVYMQLTLHAPCF